MKIHHALEAAPGVRPALAIGVFDGMHRGHRALLAELLPYCGDGAPLAALTFRNHPLAYLRPPDTPPLLMTLEERVNRLAGTGVRELYLLPFDRLLAETEAEDFLTRVLLQSLRPSAVAVGAGFRYGRGRRGDVALAQRVFSEAGVPFLALEHAADGGERISSTRIRAAVAEGRMEEADRLLGTPWGFSGIVELGAGRGHDLGFPTANLRLGAELALPPDGVYRTRVTHGGANFTGLVSIGTNPTFDGQLRTVEVWIAHFDGTIYGEQLDLRELRFLRAQQRFESVDELMEQMHRDAATLNAAP